MKTEQEIKKLNDFQKYSNRHPLTCCSDRDCLRTINNGILIATKECWVCPCGEYKQEYEIS